MKTFTLLSLVVLSSTIYRLSYVDEFTLHKQVTIAHMKLKISFGDTQLTATLYDNPTSRDFITMLPITTELEDYASNEKIFYPHRKLTEEGAPGGYEPSKGDITYYAPWGDVAIFYKDFRYSEGLISLGRIDANGIEELAKIDKDSVTFEVIED